MDTQWLKRSVKPKTDELGSIIMEIFHKSSGVYEIRRVKAVLKSQGRRASIPDHTEKVS